MTSNIMLPCAHHVRALLAARMRRNWFFHSALFLLIAGTPVVAAETPAARNHNGSRATNEDRPAEPGTDTGTELKLVSKFDRDRDGVLDSAERKAALEHLAKQSPKSTRGSGSEARALRDANREPAAPRQKLSLKDVSAASREPLYSPKVLRTFFLQFDGPDWERELTVFHDTDVEVPASLMVDGKTYRDVGVSFRGSASFFNVPPGRKRSLKLALDLGDPDQHVGTYRTLNLLNGYGDPTFLRTLLYFQIAREFIAAPRANHVRVAINDENWGVYLNVQHVNTDFTRDWFRTVKGARWKASGGTRGNLAYLGDRVDDYRRHYDLKSKENARAWTNLIHLCRVLNTAPVESLEKELPAVLDIEGALKYLAIENVLANHDGHWKKAGDYNLFADERGVFHLIPQDVNDSLGASPGKDGRGGVLLDPLAGANQSGKPLLHRLLSVAAWRESYLRHVRTVAERGLDWKRLGPAVAQMRELITAEVKADGRRLYSLSAFEELPSAEAADESDEKGTRRPLSLQEFVEKRRAFLLDHPALQDLAATPSTVTSPSSP